MGLDTENAVNINAVPSAKKTSENTKTTCTNPEKNAGENQLQGMAPRYFLLSLSLDIASLIAGRSMILERLFGQLE